MFDTKPATGSLSIRSIIVTGIECLIVTSSLVMTSARAADVDNEPKFNEATAPVCMPREYAADTYFPKLAFFGQTRALAGAL